MESSEPSNATLKAARKKNPGTARQSCRRWRNTQVASCPSVTKVEMGEHHWKDCMARNCHKNLSRIGKKIVDRSHEQTEPQIQVRDLARNEKPDGVFRAREIRRVEPQSRCDKEAINSVIGILWRMADDRLTVGRPDVRVDPIPIPPRHFKARPRRIRSHCGMPRVQGNQGQ